MSKLNNSITDPNKVEVLNILHKKIQSDYCKNDQKLKKQTQTKTNRLKKNPKYITE